AELLTRSGERIWVESQGEPTMHEARCVRLCGVLRDITELKRTQDYLRQLSITDRLTGLPNRGHFTEELNAAVEDSRATGAPIAVLFFDFDRFKQINDAMGHAAGDALLVSIAMRFLDSVLEGDVVARFGGDEFVVLLRSARSETEATRIAQRLVSIFAAPHVIRGTQVVSTASVGVAYYCGDRETTGEALLCDADTALHEAKSDGKNRCRVFDADLRTSVNRRHAIEVALRSTDLASILSLEYRPVLSLESGAYVGIDASIRCASRAVA